jgi:hypothetical protein
LRPSRRSSVYCRLNGRALLVRPPPKRRRDQWTHRRTLSSIVGSLIAQFAYRKKIAQRLHLIGTAAEVADRVVAYRAARVTTLIMEPVGADPLASIRKRRELLER